MNNSYPNFIVNWGLALLTSSLYLHDRKRYLSIISFSSLVCLIHGCWLNILNVSYGFYSVYPPVGTGSCHHLASTFFTLHSAAIICHTFCNLNLPVLLPLCLHSRSSFYWRAVLPFSSTRSCENAFLLLEASFNRMSPWGRSRHLCWAGAFSPSLFSTPLFLNGSCFSVCCVIIPFSHVFSLTVSYSH